MNYKSTRGNKVVTSTYALLHGLSEDGGLYIPEKLPKLTMDFNNIENITYQDIATNVLSLFFDEFTVEELRTIVDKAYNDITFSNKKIVPLKKLNDDVSISELFHGRTLAFKDLALSIFPYLLTESRKKEKENKNILILVATSGDTGKAALEGFMDIEGVNMVVFYPKGGVSPMQEEQMRKQLGSNVEIIAIKGNFDDAQSAVKVIFSDKELREEMKEKNLMFSSANSINIGRLFPQVVYYVSTYIDLLKNGSIKKDEKFNIVVPTGNFGNILAGYVAKQIGIPINKFISASNQNNVLSDFFQTGAYNKNRDFYITNTPSMDIIISSNFERFLYYMTGKSSDRINELMNSLSSTGILKVNNNELDTISKEFYGNYATDVETVEAITKVYEKYNYLIDPHTAVGYSVYEKYHNETKDNTHSVIMATAHPFKFPTPIAQAISLTENEDAYITLEKISKTTGVDFPDKLTEVRNAEIKFSKIIDKEEILNFTKEYIKDKF